jgi:ketosteroid isomerase-like protein
MRTRLAVTALLLAPLLPCTAQTSPSAVVRTQIAQGWQAFRTAWLAGDATAAANALLSQDAITVLPDGPETHGRAAMDSVWARFLATTKVVSFDRSTDEVEVAGALAYERGHLTQVLQQGQSPPQTFNGRYLAIWTRQEDRSWKCHRIIFANAPQTP